MGKSWGPWPLPRVGAPILAPRSWVRASGKEPVLPSKAGVLVFGRSVLAEGLPTVCGTEHTGPMSPAAMSGETRS